jgi:hypothetical protein
MSLVTEIRFIDDPNKSPALRNMELHEHLTSNADWNAEFWDIEEEFLQSYSSTLASLHFHSANGFEFQAIWVSDKPKKIIELTLNNFLEVVRNNQIGTRSKYVVRKNV